MLATDQYEGGAVFSPDGRWIAYHANDTGDAAVYARPYPGPGGRVTLSRPEGGAWPVWSADGRQIFYLTMDGWLAVATVSLDGAGVSVQSRDRVDASCPPDLRASSGVGCPE